MIVASPCLYMVQMHADGPKRDEGTVQKAVAAVDAQAKIVP